MVAGKTRQVGNKEQIIEQFNLAGLGRMTVNRLAAPDCYTLIVLFPLYLKWLSRWMIFAAIALAMSVGVFFLWKWIGNDW